MAPIGMHVLAGLIDRAVRSATAPLVCFISMETSPRKALEIDGDRATVAEEERGPPLTMRVYSYSSAGRERCTGWCGTRASRGGPDSPFFFSSQGGAIIFQIRVLTRRSISR